MWRVFPKFCGTTRSRDLHRTFLHVVQIADIFWDPDARIETASTCALHH